MIYSPFSLWLGWWMWLAIWTPVPQAEPKVRLITIDGKRVDRRGNREVH